MRQLIAVFLFVLIAGTGASFSGEVREIELTDGSVVTGEIVSLHGDVYTVKSDSLGTITIRDAKVKAIRQAGASHSLSDQNTPGESLQRKMMSDKEIMAMIQSLQNDPEFQKALQDPEIMRAVNAGDVAALTSNPKFMKLLQNSTVQEIQRKVGQ